MTHKIESGSRGRDNEKRRLQECNPLTVRVLLPLFITRWQIFTLRGVLPSSVWTLRAGLAKGGGFDRQKRSGWKKLSWHCFFYLCAAPFHSLSLSHCQTAALAEKKKKKPGSVCRPPINIGIGKCQDLVVVGGKDVHENTGSRGERERDYPTV